MKEDIPYPLFDRMEVITLSGYVLEEKLKIAEQYLIPRVSKECGLTKEQIQIEPEALKSFSHSHSHTNTHTYTHTHTHFLLSFIVFLSLFFVLSYYYCYL
jgi:hypothetical protein